MNNGNTPTFRADIGMRLIVDAQNYEQVGRLMDDIGISVRALLHNAGTRAEFDFTHFNTHPCKASQIAQMAGGYGPGDVAYDQPAIPGALELTQH